MVTSGRVHSPVRREGRWERRDRSGGRRKDGEITIMSFDIIIKVIYLTIRYFISHMVINCAIDWCPLWLGKRRRRRGRGWEGWSLPFLFVFQTRWFVKCKSPIAYVKKSTCIILVYMYNTSIHVRTKFVIFQELVLISILSISNKKITHKLHIILESKKSRCLSHLSLW